METIDWSFFRKMTQDDAAFAEKLSSIFVEDCQQQRDELRAALQKNDREAMRKLAHLMFGAAQNVGASKLAAAAKKLERIAPHREVNCTLLVQSTLIEAERACTDLRQLSANKIGSTKS